MRKIAGNIFIIFIFLTAGLEINLLVIRYWFHDNNHRYYSQNPSCYVKYHIANETNQTITVKITRINPPINWNNKYVSKVMNQDIPAGETKECCSFIDNNPIESISNEEIAELRYILLAYRNKSKDLADSHLLYKQILTYSDSSGVVHIGTGKKGNSI